MANVFYFTKSAMLREIELPWWREKLPCSKSNACDVARLNSDVENIHLTTFAMLYKIICHDCE